MPPARWSRSAWTLAKPSPTSRAKSSLRSGSFSSLTSLTRTGKGPGVAGGCWVASGGGGRGPQSLVVAELHGGPDRHGGAEDERLLLDDVEFRLVYRVNLLLVEGAG